MFPPQRQSEIIRLVTQEGRVEVSDLADRFAVTMETIRRDLSELQQGEQVRRVHGGAVPWAAARSFEPLLSNRATQNQEEKRLLARRALAEIPWNGSVIFDSGSTVAALADIMPNRHLTVITNSLTDAQVLAKQDDIDISVIGGRLHANTMATVDAIAVATVSALTVDAVFISADAASAGGGLSTPYRGEAALKGAMIEAARSVIALVDHTKFGVDQLIRFATWSSIDLLITGIDLDSQTVSAIEAKGTSVALCSPTRA